MPRVYEVISLADLIDETFGPMEFEVDRLLYHEQPKAPEEPKVWERHVEVSSGGRDMSWLILLDDWPNDDEPVDCRLEGGQVGDSRQGGDSI
jgi:hypothetical protein